MNCSNSTTFPSSKRVPHLRLSRRAQQTAQLITANRLKQAMGHLLAPSLSPFSLCFSWSVFLSFYFLTLSLSDSRPSSRFQTQRHKATKRRTLKETLVFTISQILETRSLSVNLSIYNTSWIPCHVVLTAFKIALKEIEKWPNRAMKKLNISCFF